MQRSRPTKHWNTGVLACLLACSWPVAGDLRYAAAQQETAAAAPGVRIHLARFWRGDGQTLVEGMIGLPVRAADAAFTTAEVELLVRDSAARVLYREAWTDTISERLAAVARMRGSAEITRSVNFAVKPGRYDVSVAVTRGTQRDTAVARVRGFDTAPLVSDVLVSARIRPLRPDEQAGVAELKKGRLAIETGTRVTIFPTEPKLWYYLELYPVGNAAVSEQLEFAIARASGGEPLFRTQRPITVNDRGGVDAAGLPIAGLPPGDYRLLLTARAGDRSDQREARFTMGTLQEAPAVVSTAATGSEAELLDQYFSPTARADQSISLLVEALTLASPAEAVPSSTTQLPVDAKRRFLARFWSRVADPVPLTPKHELLEEYSSRVDHVSREYVEKDIGRSGVRTDRGRIYMKYGPPDVKQPLPLTGSRAVEVWKYTRARNLKFAFLDETGFSNFNLIYTTDPTELSLPDWTDRVRDVETIRSILNF